MMIWSLPISILWISLIAKDARACPKCYNATNTPILTKLGPVLGADIEYKGRFVRQFLGIPYAEPPVGELRFKKPEPVGPWNGTLVAHDMPAACIQYRENYFPWYDYNDGKSEDCLYLNMWVPLDEKGNIGSRSLATIFWIHDGDFDAGSNRQCIYRGHALASEGDVIVVTINYRLGAFGFLTSGTEDAPGNVGMYDILEALKWVHWNIYQFGGNPSKITLAGQGSGSIAVGLLCVSPLAKGLFNSVIMQSGSPAYMLAENNAANIDKSQKVADKLGCATHAAPIDKYPVAALNCLREKSAMEIAKTAYSFHPTSALYFLPSYGDELLPINARRALIDGNFTNVPVLIGNTKDEGSFQITMKYPEVFGLHGEIISGINKTYAEKIMRDIFTINPLLVIDHYIGDVQVNDHRKLLEQVYTALGDFSFLCPTVYFAESYARQRNDVFFYYFIHRHNVTAWADWMGVTHFAVVPFVFGLPMREPDRYTGDEVLFSRKIMNIWSTFAEFGILEDWPMYSRLGPEYQELHADTWSTFNRGPHKENCDFFRDYFGFSRMPINYWI